MQLPVQNRIDSSVENVVLGVAAKPGAECVISHCLSSLPLTRKIVCQVPTVVPS